MGIGLAQEQYVSGYIRGTYAAENGNSVGIVVLFTISNDNTFVKSLLLRDRRRRQNYVRP